MIVLRHNSRKIKQLKFPHTSGTFRHFRTYFKLAAHLNIIIAGLSTMLKCTLLLPAWSPETHAALHQSLPFPFIYSNPVRDLPWKPKFFSFKFFSYKHECRMSHSQRNITGKLCLLEGRSFFLDSTQPCAKSAGTISGGLSCADKQEVRSGTSLCFNNSFSSTTYLLHDNSRLVAHTKPWHTTPKRGEHRGMQPYV